MIKHEQIRINLKDIIDSSSHLSFITMFLKSFEFPKSTIQKIEIAHKENANVTILKTKIMFISSQSRALHVVMEQVKIDISNSFKERFIVIFNENEIFSFDTKTNESLKSSKKGLFNYFDFFLPLLGQEKAETGKNQSVDLKAAEKLASIYNELILHQDFKKEFNIDDLNITIARLLFCFWMDSKGLLGNGVLIKIFSHHSSEDGSNTNLIIKNIFAVLGSKKTKDLPNIFNELPVLESTLFEENIRVPFFSKKARGKLLELCSINWQSINPDVLGSLIQSIIDPENNTGLSNHYTSSANILKVIGPLFLDDINSEFDTVANDVKGLSILLEKICYIRIFDPSCGAGNFIIVSFRELKNLEIEIRNKILSLGGDIKTIKTVDTSQIYGIESDKFKALIAKIGICISYFQASQIENIESNSISKVFELANIFVGNPCNIDWSSFCPSEKHYQVYLVTNPTYRGARKQTPNQKKDIQYVFKDYSGTRNLDYSSCWVYLASKFIDSENARAAIVTTNSLTQGEQVELLWPKVYGHNVEINFAHTSFKWKNSSKGNSGVTVVIIGLRKKSSCKKVLYTTSRSFETDVISPYLTTGVNIIVKKQNTPISSLPVMHKGNMPYDGGNLILSSKERLNLINEFPESSKWIKKLLGSKEFIQGAERWCLWISDSDLSDAMLISPIKERIQKVFELRKNSSDKSAKKLALRSHQFREINLTTTHSIIIPSVSSERREYVPIGFVDNTAVITNLAFAIYDCDPWVFGVLTSKMHNLWIRTVCGALETRIRYSSRLGYNTFPFPDIDKNKRNNISECVYKIVSEREKHSEKTMAQLYDPEKMPDSLRTSHRTLDQVIEQCYRSESFISDQERLDYLFKMYKEKLNGKHS
ncbi:SAM-dependent methyltransferase [Flavobacteriales bacterium]|nr:SAM-dependent methyltransferase [Flavobacteriales bacterium]